jgi:hypothetical protein
MKDAHNFSLLISKKALNWREEAWHRFSRNFPDLVAAAIIHDRQVRLLREATQIRGGDQIIIASEGKNNNMEVFKSPAVAATEEFQRVKSWRKFPRVS